MNDHSSFWENLQVLPRYAVLLHTYSTVQTIEYFHVLAEAIAAAKSVDQYHFVTDPKQTYDWEATLLLAVEVVELEDGKEVGICWRSVDRETLCTFNPHHLSERHKRLLEWTAVDCILPGY